LWETHTLGIFGKCQYVDVDVVDYQVTDYMDDLVYSSGGIGRCTDRIQFYAEGGEHTLEVQGYYLDHGDLVLGWEAVCEDLEVDGIHTPLYDCKVWRVRGGQPQNIDEDDDGGVDVRRL